MSTQEWPAHLTLAIAAEIRYHRTRLRWSAQQLGARCAELGMEIPRATIADLETGRRAHVSVAELLVLARALNVAPLALMLPVRAAGAKTTEILPGQDAETWASAKWVTGEELFPGTLDPDEVPVRETDIALYRVHDKHEDDEYLAALAAADAHGRAARTRSAAERQALLGQAQAWRAAMREARNALLDTREIMRARGLVLPAPEILTEEQDIADL